MLFVHVTLSISFGLEHRLVQILSGERLDKKEAFLKLWVQLTVPNLDPHQLSERKLLRILLLQGLFSVIVQAVIDCQCL